MNPPSSPSSASSADIPLIELDFSNGCFVSSSVHPTIKRVFKKVGIAKKDLKNKTMVPIIFDCLMTVFSEIHSSEVEELKCYVEKKRTQSENIFSSQSPRLSNPSPPPPSSIPFPPSTLPPPSLLLPHHPSPSILPPQHEKEFIGNEKKEEKGIKVERIDEGNQRKEEGREVVMGEGKEEDREKEREDRREEEREGKIEESHDNCEKEDQQKGNCDEGKEKEIGEEHKSEDAGCFVKFDLKSGVFIIKGIHPKLKQIFIKAGIRKKDLLNKQMAIPIIKAIVRSFCTHHGLEAKEPL